MTDQHPWPPFYFTREGSAFQPNGLARNPWFADAVAGGPVSALFATIIEESGIVAEMQIARLTIDILGKVPSKLLEHRITPVREGRQMQLHRVELICEAKIVAQAHVLLVRHLETPPTLPPCDYPPPNGIEPSQILIGATMAGAIETRAIRGHVTTPGRGTMWLSMSGQIVEGRPASPFAKACLFADFGNGIGSATRPDEWSFANLDIDIHFLRMPQGEWFLLDAHTEGCGNGHALTQSLFADEEGIYAKGTQTIFVAPAIVGSRFKPG
jgi:Thioesterase-like superfamily